MKTTIKTSLILLVMATAFSVTSCKSKKKQEVAAPTGEVLVNEYCTGPEFFSDKKTFRANAVSESMDQQTAKNKSMIEAKQKLASFINTTIKSKLGIISEELQTQSHQLSKTVTPSIDS